MRTWLEKAVAKDNPSSRDMRSDFDLNPDLRGTYKTKYNGRPAAVLVPIVDHASGPTVLLTQRTDHLNNHAGQISFPGGAIDTTDTSPEAAAIREAHEEIGLDPALVDVVGRLDDYETSTGFHIVPILALVKPDFTLTLDAFEVAEAFEVPLSFFLDNRNHERQSRIWQGVERFYYVMPYRERFIWGATAAMLVNLYDVMTISKGNDECLP